METQVGEDLGADAVFVLQEALALGALVVAELAIMGDEAGGLAVFRAQLESGAAFVQVNQHAAILGRDLPQGVSHQALAVAAGRAENIAIEATGVHAYQDVFSSVDLAAHQRQVVFGV